jgi:hypothetical protein
LEQVTQLELAHYTIRQIEKEFQSFLSAVGGLEIEGIAYRDCNLIGDDR